MICMGRMCVLMQTMMCAADNERVIGWSTLHNLAQVLMLVAGGCWWMLEVVGGCCRLLDVAGMLLGAVGSC